MDEAAKAQDIADNKDLAALSYAWILSIVIYLIRGKRSPFICFHAKQGIALFVLSIVFWIVPVVGRLLELLVLAGIIAGFMNAAQGHWKEVPIVGPLARGNIAGVRQDFSGVVQFFAQLWKRWSTKTAKPTETPTIPPAAPPQNP